jgi:hypothetical protein
VLTADLLFLDRGERLSKNNPKNVAKKRHDFTKPEREFLRGIVHNLSFQRLTDREIVLTRNKLI